LHCRQHPLVADAPAAQLALDHAGALRPEAFFRVSQKM
jgi:hypothetical protein